VEKLTVYARNTMKITKTENINFDHVKLMDTGSPLPVVFSIDEGYRRGACYKTKDGENVAIIGVSNVKAKETTIDYKEQEGEEITALLGLVINSKQEAEVLGEFFMNIAKQMS